MRAFPNAWIEDPDCLPRDRRHPRRRPCRITWDAPIHSVADIEALPFPPRMVNLKPSRIGGLPSCATPTTTAPSAASAAYSGGQFELGPGRGQNQYLASLFHPDTPNDVAPMGYNLTNRPAGLPDSPLPASPSAVGFRWGSSRTAAG